MLPGINFRPIRNSQKRLLCEVDDITGEVKTEGPHKSYYFFNIPVGGTFIVTRDNITSLVTRTATCFMVEDSLIA